MNDLDTVDTVTLSPAEVAREHIGMNRLDALLSELPQADFPLAHQFTPGLYARQIFMAKGILLTSKIHKTEHQFVITQGVVSVFIDGVGVQTLRAPYFGITKAGTRRALYIHEDTVWTTFHPTNETDFDKIEAELIHPHDPRNPALAAEARMAHITEESQ